MPRWTVALAFVVLACGSQPALVSIAGDADFSANAASGEVGTGDQPGAVAQIEPIMIEFDDLNLPYYVDRDLTEIALKEEVTDLDGELVEMRVFMQAPYTENAVPAFVGIPLVEIGDQSRVAAEFRTRLPHARQVRYVIPVILEDGSTIRFNRDRYLTPILIRGTLRVDSDKIDAKDLRWPFTIENATWQPVHQAKGVRRLWFGFPC